MTGPREQFFVEKLETAFKEGGLRVFGTPGFHVVVLDMEDEWCRMALCAILEEYTRRLFGVEWADEHPEVAD